jgi:hypothetical protein
MWLGLPSQKSFLHLLGCLFLGRAHSSSDWHHSAQSASPICVQTTAVQVLTGMVVEHMKQWLHQELNSSIAAGSYKPATCLDFVVQAIIIENTTNFGWSLISGQSTNPVSTCHAAMRASRTYAISCRRTSGCCLYICKMPTGTSL